MPKFNDFEIRLLNGILDSSINAEQHPVIKEATVAIKQKVNYKPQPRAKKAKAEGVAATAKKG